MKLIILILAGLSSFALGVIAGLMRNRRTEKAPAVQYGQVSPKQLEILNEEYRNFLNYDGSEQI